MTRVNKGRNLGATLSKNSHWLCQNFRKERKKDATLHVQAVGSGGMTQFLAPRGLGHIQRERTSGTKDESVWYWRRLTLMACEQQMGKDYPPDPGNVACSCIMPNMLASPCERFSARPPITGQLDLAGTMHKGLFHTSWRGIVLFTYSVRLTV